MKSNTAIAAISAMICFAMEAAANVKADPIVPGSAGQQPLTLVPGSYIAMQMAYTLVPLTLAFVLLLVCCCICRMDPDKSQDTMLYAKFIANTDAKNK